MSDLTPYEEAEPFAAIADLVSEVERLRQALATVQAVGDRAAVMVANDALYVEGETDA